MGHRSNYSQYHCHSVQVSQHLNSANIVSDNVLALVDSARQVWASASLQKYPKQHPSGLFVLALAGIVVSHTR